MTSPPKPAGSRPLRRLLGYCCAAVLLLSLPTFSDWVPTVLVVPYTGQVERSALVPPRESASTPVTAPSASAPSRNSRPQATAPGFVSARRSQPPSSNEPASAANRSEVQPPEATTTGAGGAPVAAPRARGAASGQLSEPTAVLDELSLMESEFQSVYTNLFTGGGGLANNPFQEALDEKQGQNGDQGGAGGGNGDGADGGADGGSPGNGGNDSPPPPDSPPADDGPSGTVFSHLVVGFEDQTLPRSSRRLLHRAYRSGLASFVLENGLQWDLLPGVLGPGREVLIADQNEQVTTVVASNRTSLRYLLARPSWQGTVLEERSGPATSRPVETRTLFYFKMMRSVAAFDYSGGGAEELVATFHDNPTLVVLRRGPDGTPEYQRELVLPFAAAFAVGSRSRLISDVGYIHVFDERMQRWVAFSTRQPGTYSFSKPPSHVRTEEIEVETASGARIRYELQVYETCLALWEDGASGLRLLGSFSTELGAPTVVVGDYLQNGRRQLVLLP